MGARGKKRGGGTPGPAAGPPVPAGTRVSGTKGSSWSRMGRLLSNLALRRTEGPLARAGRPAAVLGAIVPIE